MPHPLVSGILPTFTHQMMFWLLSSTPACLATTLQELVYGTQELVAVGVLADHDKPLLFTMARLDRAKNLTGLVEW